jgi:hypothetical protein
MGLERRISLEKHFQVLLVKTGDHPAGDAEAAETWRFGWPTYLTNL